jgi:hypothetical protein
MAFQGGPEAEQFLRRLAQIVGVDDYLTLESGPEGLVFRLARREFDEFTVTQIGQSFEMQGRAQSEMRFQFRTKGEGLNCCEKFLAAIATKEMRVSQFTVRCRDRESWPAVRKWIMERTQGPWEIMSVNLEGTGWTAEQALQVAPEIDAFPVGLLDFRGSREVGLPLKGKCFFVDAFREGDGWHLAFHLFEGAARFSRRENIRKALNAYLGEELITRTPEMLWPDLYEK